MDLQKVVWFCWIDISFGLVVLICFVVTVSQNIVDIDLSLSTGWNLISLPITPDDPSLTYMFPDAEVAYKFDGTYQLVENLSPGTGYWVKLTTGGVYSITGRNFPQCNLTLAPGWHLVGGINATSTPVTDPAGEIIVMYGFEGTYSEATEFVPGKGYWVKVNSGCNLSVEQACLINLNLYKIYEIGVR